MSLSVMSLSDYGEASNDNPWRLCKLLIQPIKELNKDISYACLYNLQGTLKLF